MKIVVDTSALIAAFTGERLAAHSLRELVAAGHELRLPAVALFEWLRGPRTEEELADQAALFPPESILDFGSGEANKAANVYRTIRRGRGRESNIMIAATALAVGAAVWTLNREDFEDIPGLELIG
jgi:predicted nucleic acid-binding protein